MKKVIPLLCIIMLTNTGFMVILGFDVKNVKGINDPTQPPDGETVEVDGDWFVEDVKEYHNCTIIMNGNLIVNNTGSLTFHNVTLKMNCTYDGQYSIEVKSGGAFYIYDYDNNPLTTYDRSNITATNLEYEYLFWVRDGSKFEMKNSELHECGWDWDNKGLTVEADKTIMENCVLTNNYFGIYLLSSSNTVIVNSNIESSNWSGIDIHFSSNITISKCNISSNYFGVRLRDSQNSSITDCNISSCSVAISLDHSLNNSIVNCNLSKNHISLDSSSNNYITGCKISDSSSAISLSNSTNNGIIDCNISNNEYTLDFDTSSNNTIINCNISNNIWGIRFCSSSNNDVHNNSILGNVFYAIFSDEPSTTNAQYNYFGTKEQEQIEKLIDGNIDYSKWLDWRESNIQYINTTTSWSDIITLNKSVIVNGNLSIENGTIIFNNSQAQNFIQVNNNLTIINSNIKSNYGHFTILYLNESIGSMVNSNFKGQRGIGVQSEENISIQRCNITTGVYGIAIYRGKNNTITNCNISEGSNGIDLYCAANNIISNCTIFNNYYGIDIYEFSNNNLISGCKIYKNALRLFSSPNNTINNCNVSHKDNGVGVKLYNSSKCSIDGCSITNNYQGVSIYSSQKTTISMCVILLNDDHGIYSHNSANTTIENCNVSNNRYGIMLEYADSALIINNTIDSNSEGIDTTSSSYNQIIKNTITNNCHGMYIHGSKYSEIVGNTVSSSTYCGIFLEQSMNDKIVNNIISETSGVYGISVDRSDNEQIINATIDQTDGYGIATQYSNNITVLNSTITNSGIYDFYIPFEAQVFAINTTFNTNGVCFEDDISNLTVEWFMHVKTIDEMGQPFPNVDVSVEDVFGDNIYIGITDATGYCKWIVCTQYFQNRTSKINHTPHNVTANDGIHTNWTDAYMDESKEVIVQLDTLSYSRYLNRGWNLISIPLIQTDTDLTTVLRLIEGKYDTVRYFNATSLIDHWQTYATFVPNGYNDLTYLNHKMGLWINITTADGVMFTVTGEKPSSTQIQLYKGWNLVGYPSFTDRNVSEALEGIPYEQVEGFDENASPYYLRILSDSDIMTAGYGYWIRVTSDCIWTIYN